MPDPRRLVLALLGPPLLIGALLRVALLMATGQSTPADLGLALGLGALWDLAAWAPLAVLPFLWLARRPGGWAPRLLLALWTFAALFLAAVEWSFWQEFTCRLNHVAIDYLLFPREVAGNIWESFNVPAVVGVAAGIAGAAAWALQRWTWRAAGAPASWRPLAATAVLLLAATALAAVLPERLGGRRERDEIAGNGLVAVSRAALTSAIDYRAMYATLPTATAQALVAADAAAGDPAPVVRRDRPYDVLVVMEESLGAEFSRAWGGSQDLTPGIERWMAAGTAVLDCVPTGNRTVRGLEGVLCGLPPVPPESVVKRAGMAGIASLARVFARAGATSEFFYGGAASFDHLGHFAEDAGFTAMHDDPAIGAGAFPAGAFRTAWGVADEHLLDAVLARQVAAQAAGEGLFLTALTVSNHKPFLIPGPLGRPEPTPPGKVRKVAYAGLAAALAILAVLLVAPLRRRLGLPTAIAAAVLAAAAWGGYAAWKLGATDHRENAVRYADWAVARYLDQARAAGVLAHTVVLVVGDHGARVYGSAEVPLDSYQVISLFVHPDPAWQGRRIAGLCSQIDLAPTLCSLAGVAAGPPFPGVDLARLGHGPGRAFIQHNRSIGLLTADRLAVLGLKRERTLFRRDGNRLERLTPDPDGAALLDRATAWFQQTDAALRAGTYRLP